MIDFCSQNGPQIGPKSLLKRFRRALERDLNEDSIAKLKKEAAKSTGGALVILKLEGFGAISR